jgi:hypothetical protein
VLDAKIDDSTHTFKTRTSTASKTAKLGNTSFPYYQYNDLTTKEISMDDRHWWMIKGSAKASTGEISLASGAQDLHFEAFQFYPPR